METNDIYRLVYALTFNSGRVDSAPVALQDILLSSRRNNTRDGITGYLIFDGKTFIAILKGAKDA